MKENQEKRKRKNKRYTIILFMIVTFVFLSACDYNIDTNMSESMEDFAFTTQNGKTLSLEDLKGNWWIANLAYTNCRTVCPRTTANMVEVQNRLSKDGLSPQIISFSVDPSNDTPEVLKEYAEEYGADQETWNFLTGYNFETIQEISENTFQSVLEEGAADQKSHSYAFYLINPDGDVIKQYNGMNTSDIDTLVDDIRTVLH